MSSLKSSTLLLRSATRTKISPLAVFTPPLGNSKGGNANLSRDIVKGQTMSLQELLGEPRYSFQDLEHVDDLNLRNIGIFSYFRSRIFCKLLQRFQVLITT